MSVKARRAKLGKRNPNWKGGRALDWNGYVTIPTGKPNKRKYQHRVKAGAGRGEAVHHRNNKRKGFAARRDNRQANLKVTRRHPGRKGK